VSAKEPVGVLRQCAAGASACKRRCAHHEWDRFNAKVLKEGEPQYREARATTVPEELLGNGRETSCSSGHKNSSLLLRRAQKPCHLVRRHIWRNSVFPTVAPAQRYARNGPPWG